MILIAVLGATILVGALGLAASADVSVLGSLPQGLPAFALPWISYADLGPVVTGGLAVALVSFADTSVLSRSYAARTRTYVDPNQEMVGLGAATRPSRSNSVTLSTPVVGDAATFLESWPLRPSRKAIVPRVLFTRP